MHYYFTPYILPLALGAIVSGWVALYGWKHRSTRGAVSFTVLMVGVTFWIVAYTFEVLGADTATKEFWTAIKYCGVVVIAPSWLAFALEYTGRGAALTFRRIALLLILPLVTLALALTNGAHHLFWTPMQLVATGPFVTLDVSNGVWFWVNVAYAYLLILIGSILIVQALVRQPRLYRGQIVGMLVAVAGPWVFNFLTNFKIIDVHLDLTPFVFLFTGLALAWSLFRYRLLDLMPVARAAVIEAMSDAMIVLDAQARVADLNPAAQRLLGVQSVQVMGQDAAKMFHAFPDLVAHYRDRVDARNEIVIGEGAAREYYDLRLSPLRNRQNEIIGRVITLRDITERKRMEQDLAAARFQLDDLLHRFVPASVADQMIANPQVARPGGERRQVTVMFADLRGFTRWAESKTPEQIIEMVNRLVGIGIEAILAEGGTLDKIMGDALMGTFNTPLTQPDHARRAVRAARAMLVQQPLEADLCFSIGIHTGTVVAGNVGTERVMNYTVLGDAVNLAKRLQEMAQPGQILMSQETYAQLKGELSAQFIGAHILRGREEPTEIFAVSNAMQVQPVRVT